MKKIAKTGSRLIVIEQLIALKLDTFYTMSLCRFKGLFQEVLGICH